MANRAGENEAGGGGDDWRKDVNGFATIRCLLYYTRITLCLVFVYLIAMF